MTSPPSGFSTGSKETHVACRSTPGYSPVKLRSAVSSFRDNGGGMPRKRHRLAAIDVGTNSIHMIVVETERHGYRVIDKEKEMVQLGRGSLGGEPLTPAAIRRGVAATKKMAEIARRWSVNEVIAVATSAVREARNRKTFTREIEKSSGIR